MNFEDTDFTGLEKSCALRFGEADGKKIYLRAVKLYTELVVTTDYRNSMTLERQLRRVVYPVIAYYKTLLAFGYREQVAVSLVRREMLKAAEGSAQALKNQMRPVFPFGAFRRNIKNFIEYKFPAEGWISGDLEVRRRSIRFNIHKCMYCAIAGKFGCPELRILFCEYERAMFAGLLPQVVASCGETLANGHNSCSFSFVKGGRHATKEESPRGDSATRS